MRKCSGLTSLALLLATAVTGLWAPAGAAADDYLVGLWGRAQIGQFEESWQGDDPARLDAAFGPANSSDTTNDGYGCTKRWDGLGMKVDLWTFGSMTEDPCEAGLFGRAQLTSPLFHTSTGISPGDSARKARRKSVAKCNDHKPYRYCGSKGYILSTHRSECAGGRVPSVVARVRGTHVSSLIVFTTGCE